jgi:polyribonucleotide nucleotidyltransferase
LFFLKVGIDRLYFWDNYTLKVVDDLKAEISAIKEAERVAAESAVTPNQIAMELPEPKSLSSKTRELAKKLNEQHEKEINDPNSLKRQGGVSKAQIAYALNKFADLIDAGEKAVNAIKKVLAEFTNESERNEVADYFDKLFEKELAEEANIDNNVNLKEKWQPQTKEEMAFQSLSEAFEKSISKESSAARLEGRTMREKIIKENPEIARVAENIKDIYEQLQAKGLIKKEGNCP